MSTAQGKCPVIQAMLADGSEKLAGIGITINRDGKVDVTRNGVPDVIRGADSCDLFAPSDGFDLSCSWRFDGGLEADSERAFETLLRRLNGCLPLRLQKKQSTVYTEERLEEMRTAYGDSFVAYLRNNEDLSHYEGSFDLNEDEVLDVRLDLTREKDSGNTRMSLNLTR